jgi:glycosyltransferase involved in cell wall biosynthesis
MKRLEVVLVVPSLEAGGAERVTINLANGLARSGAVPRVVVTDRAGTLRSALDEHIDVEEFSRTRVRHAAARLIRRLRKLRPDVVFVTHTHVNLMMCALRPLLPRGARLVVREPLHAPIGLAGRSTERTRRAQSLLYRHADLVIASSDVIATDLTALTGARVVRLENAVDIAAIRATVEAPDRLRRIEHRGIRMFVSVGRLSPQKAMDDLIRAFASGAGPEDRLRILGEGPERGRLQALIDALGLADRVELCGVRTDHWAYVAAADALVLASGTEGMPNAVLEALALGTPVLATTDLEVLDALAEEVLDGALRLVPRAELAAAIAATPSRPVTDRLADPLLPERFDADAVSGTLLHMLQDLAAERDPRTRGARRQRAPRSNDSGPSA